MLGASSRLTQNFLLPDNNNFRCDQTIREHYLTLRLLNIDEIGDGI
jgi:hypothetical protein